MSIRPDELVDELRGGLREAAGGLREAAPAPAAGGLSEAAPAPAPGDRAAASAANRAASAAASALSILEFIDSMTCLRVMLKSPNAPRRPSIGGLSIDSILFIISRHLFVSLCLINL
jgi:hypothetical protein